MATKVTKAAAAAAAKVAKKKVAKKKVARRRWPPRRKRLSPEETRVRRRRWTAMGLVPRVAPFGFSDVRILYLLADAFVSEEYARMPAEIRDAEAGGVRPMRFVWPAEITAFEIASDLAIDLLVAEIARSVASVTGTRRLVEGSVVRLVKSAWDNAFLFAEEDAKRTPAPKTKAQG